MVDIIHDGGWNEWHRCGRPLMSILSNLALPHDALCVVLSFWPPPGRPLSSAHVLQRGNQGCFARDSAPGAL